MSEALLEALRRAVLAERDALDALARRLDRRAVEAVERLYACRGRVLVTGMGKAGIVGRKVAATLASTGTPAYFLHPAEALHGDLGAIGPEDLALVLSTSGETEEVLRLLPHLRRAGVPIIALTGRPASTLGRNADLVLDAAVEREADPLDLVPTASTTALLALGDALAAALIARRGFTREDFAIFHPGGTLGRKLLLRVADLMHVGEAVPLVGAETPLREALVTMSAKGLGALFVVDREGRLRGVFTDGDLRRLLERESRPLGLSMEAVMTRTPRVVRPGALAAQALRLMEEHAITVLPVIDEQRRPLGALHMHDLVRAGLA